MISAKIVEELRDGTHDRAAQEFCPELVKAADAAANEIERLILWMRRIDNINDDPARFSAEIDKAIMDAMAGKPMTGKVNVRQKCANCHNANEHGDYEGPTCHVCGGDGFTDDWDIEGFDAGEWNNVPA